MLKFRGFRESHSTHENCALEIDLKPHPFIIAACSVAKNQLLLSLIKSLYRYFTANKDPSGPLSRIVPCSSIEAANAKVRIQRRRRPVPIIEFFPYSGRPNALVDMPTNHRFNTEGHSPAAAVLLVGVVQLGLTLEIYSTKKLDSGNLENLVPRK